MGREEVLQGPGVEMERGVVEEGRETTAMQCGCGWRKSTRVKLSRVRSRDLKSTERSERRGDEDCDLPAVGTESTTGETRGYSENAKADSRRHKERLRSAKTTERRRVVLS
jgi:hypothetical protein